MANNELDTLSAGDIAPYDPGMPVLAPLSPTPDTWGRTDVLTNQEINDYQRQPQSPTLFGAAMPAGTTPQAIQSVLGEVAGTYLSDFTKLNYPSALIQSAISFFMENATKPARQVTPRHSFKLPKELSNDWLAVLFANHLQGLSGTQHQKQQFLNASLVWIDKLNKHLNSQQLGASQGKPAHGRAPQTTDPLDSLNDQQYEWVIKANQAAALQTEITLRRKWGDSSYLQNVQVAQDYLENLPPSERAHFNQYTTGWIHSLNTVEVIEFLFNNAIGAGNIPTAGGAVQAEINQIENLMRTNKAAYNKDNQIQARLRTLYNIRDKG